MARKIPGVVFVFLLIAGISVPVLAESSDPVNKVTISGTSTVRDWSCSGEALVTAVPGKTATSVTGFPNGVEKVVVEVSVMELKCPDGGKKMEEHMQKALKAKDHPKIVYELEGYALNDSGGALAKGTLTIGGVKKPVEFEVSLASLEDGAGVLAGGSAGINMRDYGIEPPKLMFGALKVGAEINVTFGAAVTSK